MKKINLNIVASDYNKKITLSGKLYYFETVECVISGVDVESVSTVRSAIYDGDTQVVAAVNFKPYEGDKIYCEFHLQTEALQEALSETKPNSKKNFTLYIWDQNEEEMVAAGTIPIYNNPYIEDEVFENVTVTSNFLAQYSSDGGNTWVNDVPEHVSHIRFSIDGGSTWQDKIYISPIAVDDSNSSSISIDNVDVDSSYVKINTYNGESFNLKLSQLDEIFGPKITIYD